ncbi:hypothetical protein SmJEL517_g02398 [Synchytrium microbalum]|uniref:RRM domain-containing protein n=1 Tax=Synchytrium microbalum TaxID=1806994 RepID=A0A507CAM7_9FUNG|nr:uncharacterized protein SmJEL517_g02398 [Synchytrium microbalum]TPX35044.1 hypothetical protein SmJEL517_g02398 [Synchytrium microbalum]
MSSVNGDLILSPASNPQLSSSSYEDQFDATSLYGQTQLPSPASGPIPNHQYQSGYNQYYASQSSISPTPMVLPSQMLSTSLPTNSLHHIQTSQMGHNANMMNSPQEEITTIFVVGFPDDMLEREFQNMFTFCPGFEAATLKIPPPALSSNADNAVSPTSIDESGRNGRGSNGVTIGFAKFSSRLESLEALRVLNGRKVDAEKNSILKAEMAKKNLHTKRGLSNDNLMMMMTGASYNSMGRRSTVANISSKELYVDTDYQYAPPIPRDILSQVDYLDIYPGESSRLTRSASSPAPYNKDAGSDSYSGFMDGATSYGSEMSGMDSATSSRPTSITAPSSGIRTPPSLMERSSYERGYSEMIDPVMMNTLLSRSNGSSSQASPTSGGPSTNGNTHNTERRFSTTTPAEAFANGSSTNGNNNTASSSNNGSSQRGFNSALYQSESLLSERMANMNGNGSSNSTSQAGSGASSSPSGNGQANGFASYGNTSLPRSASLSDNASRNSDPRVTDYPPCNTLYVGNLPMNTSEEELRALFSKCAASPYPQCFVEFEDVACANLALRELYGNPLSNSTKGGIRLSYSKNPLGKRSTSDGPSSTSPVNGSSMSAIMNGMANMNMMNAVNAVMSNGFPNVQAVNGYPITLSMPRNGWNAASPGGSLNVMSPPFVPAGEM